MKRLLHFIISVFSSYVALSQDNQAIINKLPDFISPTPEVSNLLKADNLTVGYSSGSPNINIPLFNFKAGNYALPISLNYSSTGMKVDDYASMVGMGWNLNYGGVISRTVMDQPDENRDANNCNLSGIDMTSLDAALMTFLTTSTDNQSDIFNFSFPGYNGKFILDLDLLPVQLTKNNLKIQVIDNYFDNGFIITTDDGTVYRFEDIEVSKGRNPSGSNCEKTYDVNYVNTSWYLTKIILPNTRREIHFTYVTADIDFENSITQTISKVLTTGQYECTNGTGPTGDACPVGTERFSTCISQQTVSSKFVTKIESSEGDKVEFLYDDTNRADLNGGKRLKGIKVLNRSGLLVSRIYIYSDYQTATTGTGYRSKRLFLDSLNIKGSDTTAIPLKYKFSYIDYGNLPRRLTYAQDFYGYNNGKSSNPSLIPVLPNSDPHYSTFENGQGAVMVDFGDRSIDTAYAVKGLLNKIVYPLGGYDSILYIPNRTSGEVLAGGNAVSKIRSFSEAGTQVLEKEFIYRYKSDNTPSSFLLTDNLRYSQTNTTQKDAYVCNEWGGVHCEGPACTFAVVTSNTNHPLTTFGSQHLYFRSVLERINGVGTDNGLIEHIYSYFNGGNLGTYHRMGNYVLSAMYEIVPDILVGETYTKHYKNGNGSYTLVRAEERKFRLDSLDHFVSYNIKRNFEYGCYATPPGPSEFEPFDVDETYINIYTVQLDTTIVTEYMENGSTITKTTAIQYDGPYTYPTRITTTGSDGLEEKTEYKYPQDYATMNYMLARNIVKPVIEEKQFKDNTLTITKTNSYRDWFSDGKIIVPDTSEIKLYNSNKVQRIVFYSYDTLANPIELFKENDQINTYIWDYKNNLPIAKIQNANNGSIAYTSFEADSKGNWTFSGAISTDTTSPTGRKYYGLSGGEITKSGLLSQTKYVISYWKKDGSGTAAVNSSGGISIITKNGWTLYEHELSGTTSLTISGSGSIDELRLYPKGTLMTTYTFEPLIGMSSQCDPNNRIIYYEYDPFGRLRLIRDQDRNILKTMDYKYAVH